VYVTGRSDDQSTGRLPGTVRKTAAEVDGAGGRGIPVACDQRDDSQVAALFERVREQSGRLDVLVNSSFQIPRELTSGKPFWQVPLSNWDDMIDVGLRSAYVASWHAAQVMAEQRGGLIANVSSSGAAEYAWHVVYGVGKCALDRMTADMAHELRKFEVAVVSLWPGLVLTERTQAFAETGALDATNAESQRFTGRAIAHLAGDPKVLSDSGHALTSRSLAERYGFRDVDGRMPDGPLHERPAGLD
ncbi:MAG: SDR family NAD(P)-dependent oxidoreductase, partial [Myxococcota bacterium]